MLVVEDNKTNQSILTDQALAWGMRPQTTASAQEALKWVRRGDPFDLAVVEKNMPEMDGASLSDAIRKHRSRKDLPIILLASLVERDIDITGMSVDAVLSKPIKPSQLFDTLVDLSAGKSVTRQPKEDEVSSSFDAEMGKNYPLRILLAEDNVNNQKLALLVLDRLGYRADVAGNGIEVLEALQRQAYDVVFMDVQMPDMDGLEAARNIREQWRDQTKPWVVAMTANAMQGDREMCLAAGMNDYVTKPIRLEHVVTSLKRGWESLPGMTTEISPETTNVPVATDESPGMNETSQGSGNGVLDAEAIKRLEQLAGGDKSFLIDFIDTFLDDTTKMVGDLKQSLDSGDAVTLRRVAHTLKSNSAALGASRLSELCRELEELGKMETLEDAPRKVGLVELEFKPIKTALESMREGYVS